MVSKKVAYEAFVYHGEHIYGPSGVKDAFHDNMRQVWAYVYDNGLYRKIQSSCEPWVQDEQARELYRQAKETT